MQAGQSETVAGITAYPVGGFTLGNLLTAFGILLFTLLLRKVLIRVFFASLKQLAKKTKSSYDDRFLDALEYPASLLVLWFGIYTAVTFLDVSPEIQVFASRLFLGATIFVIFWGLMRVIDVVADILQEASEKKGHSISAYIPLIKKTTRLFVGVIGIIMVLDNLGYSVGGIIATLGIGGAAFAFAAKDTIANLYGSLALALDRPFKVGDWIQVGDAIDGDVEEVGLRSTKVRSWPKTVLSIPNSVLANEVINNWSRMPKRRVKQYIGVTYDAKADDMDALVGDIRTLLREDEGVQQDFILVNFTDFGDYSLQILVYYFTASTQWIEHMNVRQRINTKIMRAVEARGMDFAFPTRTLHLAGQNADKLGDGSGRLPGDFGPDAPA